MKVRLITELKKHILICAIALAYYAWVVTTNIYIPCVFKLATGLKCPGCGITHMIIDILHLDFQNAFYENPLLFVALPFAVISYAINRVYYIRNGRKKEYGKISHALLYAMLILIIIFWIVRNLPVF